MTRQKPTLSRGERQVVDIVTLALAAIAVVSSGLMTEVAPVSVVRPIAVGISESVAPEGKLRALPMPPAPLEAQTPLPADTPPMPLAQQTGVAPNSVIAGRVVDGVTGEPIAGATAELWTSDFRPVTPRGVPIVTDDGGRFEFPGLQPGAYQLEATRDGYFPGAWGKLSPVDHCCSKVVVNVAERLADVDVRLWPAASISGAITDERGEPVVKATVRFLRREYVDGRLAWVGPWSARTDDRGHFASGTPLRPGDYLVVLPAVERALGLGGIASNTVFYGGARVASQATVVTLTAGERRTDVNLTATFTSAPRSLFVSGYLTADGTPLPRATVELVRRDSEAAVAHLDGFKTLSTDPAGAFSFSYVPEGEYQLRAWRFPPAPGGETVQRVGSLLMGQGFRGVLTRPLVPDAPTWIADLPLFLTQSVNRLVVPLQPGARISGRVVLDGHGEVPSAGVLAGLRVLVLPAHGRDLGLIPIGGVEMDGSFRTAGLPPGEYVFHLQAGARVDGKVHVLQSVRVGERELLGRVIDVAAKDVTDVVLTLSDRSWDLSGFLRVQTGKPAPGARVIVFPRDPERRQSVGFVRPASQASADRSGAFQITGWIAGDYLAVAVTAPPEFWMVPEYLETLVPFATPVRLELGGKGSVDLKVR